MNKSTFPTTLYLVTILGLFVYSFTQVDLNLTLTSFPVYQSIQSSLTHIGYFNRPLSTLLYFAILILMLISYLLLIHQSKKTKTKSSKYIKLALITSIILTLSYPAFSYDIFNYIFDARILATHGQNPLTHTALDFPSDLWTRFMRWTHRTYPYGPTWLPLTLPFYISGLGKFTATLVAFKTIGSISYLASCYCIYHISRHLQPKAANTSLALFAFNPLIIIEMLVSAHLDSAMAALMLVAIWLALTAKSKFAFATYLVSVGIKYISLAAAPLIFRLKPINFSHRLKLSLILAYLLTLVVISQREILPWYFITPFALTALIPQHRFATNLMIALTVATLSRYAPFLYVGDYTDWVINARNLLTITSFSLTLVVTYFKNFRFSQ